ncbi:MAG: hypothetical protein FWD71_11310, partial [Oscillospiraceae bacterium]|nr:hypothetical protein [Oscillospiraceae bacterium]
VPFAGILNKMEEGKAALENLYTNYLPAYTRIVNTIKNAESSLQVNFADMLSPEKSAGNNPGVLDSGGTAQNGQGETTQSLPQFTVTYVGEDAYRKFYAVRPYDFLESVLKLDEADLRKNMLHESAEINRLIKANTDVNFYLYIGRTMQDEEYFNDIFPDELCTAPMFHEFMDSIEGAAGKDYFKIDTLENRLIKQWKTDHHWNAAGSYSGYCDIINMMRKNTPEIGEPVKILDTKAYPNIKMRGSYAALSGYTDFYEPFYVNIYDLQNQGPGQYSMRSREAEYDAGVYDNSQDIFLDNYVNYYFDRRQYQYDNNNGRNLLIIGDSLTYWTAWLIAANFDNTYVYFPWDAQTIDYNRYIKDHNITDVLMLVYSQAGIFNVYGYCNYEQLQTK